MLFSNQTPVRIRFLGGALGGACVTATGFVSNAAGFTSRTSVPQGYNDPAKALVPPVKTGGEISARVDAATTLAADLRGIGNMAATLPAEADMVADANVLANGYATFDAEADMIAALGGIGNISANMDLLARPSANDIAQEVWAAQAATFSAAGTIAKEIVDAKAAATEARDEAIEAKNAAKLAAALSA